MTGPATTQGRRPGRADDILDAFTRGVAARGYDATNFSEIATELGISKGTIVHHFGTKDRLLATMHESYMVRRTVEARAILQRLASPTEQLAGLLFALVRYHVVDRDATVAFQREMARLAEGETMAEGRRLRSAYVGLLESTITAGIDAGEFDPGDVAVQTRLVLGAAHWAWHWFHRDGHFDVEAVGAELVRLVVGGLHSCPVDTSALTSPGGGVLQVVRECVPQD